MWHATYHIFASRLALLAACDSAGWPHGPDQRPLLPEGVVLDEVGPILSRPTVGEDGAPVPGEVLDARYHVNAAWHGIEPPAAFQTVAVTPATPQRTFGLPLTSPPPTPVVPAVIPAWKGKAALREAGLLEGVEQAVQAAGGRILDAWIGAAEWRRDSDFLGSLATNLGLSEAVVSDMFRSADAIQS
jgi:hypothetical protein